MLGWVGHHVYLSLTAVTLPDIKPKTVLNIDVLTDLSEYKDTGETKKPPKSKQPQIVLDSYHPRVLFAKASNLIVSGELLEAIEVLKILYNQVQSEYSKADIRALLLTAVGTYLNTNSDLDQVALRIQLLTEMSDLMPEVTKLRYLLINELITDKQLYEARRQLEYLKVYPEWRQIIAKLTKKILNEERFLNGQISIPLDLENAGWIIDAQIGDNQTLRLLVDTGANTTLIAEDFISDDDKSDNVNEQQVEVQTASGQIEATETIIKSMTIGAIVDEDFPIIVSGKKLPDGVDGLLGTDWLSRFEFIIDQQNQRLLLNSL